MKLNNNFLVIVNNNITDISAELDALYGKVGSPEREQFRKEAYTFNKGQFLRKTKRDKMLNVFI